MSKLRHVLELGGLAAIGVGLYLAWPPLAWIWAGAAALLVSVCWMILSRE